MKNNKKGSSKMKSLWQAEKSMEITFAFKNKDTIVVIQWQWQDIYGSLYEIIFLEVEYN